MTHTPLSSALLSEPHGSRWKSRGTRWLNLMGNTLGTLLALGVVVLFFAVADAWQENGGKFLSQRNLVTIAAQNATVTVAALGMTAIIISAGIDLSAGTTVALCATVLAWCLKENYSPVLAVALGILTGCAAGFVNGLLISSLRVVPFIVTLGTMTLYLGIAKIIAKETTIRPDIARQVPVWLQDLVSTRREALLPYGLLYRGPSGEESPLIQRVCETVSFPSGVWIAIALSILLALVLRYSVFGRYMFALGSNESTARLCGINIAWNKIGIYTLAGFFVGIAGIFQFARLTVGSPTSGTGLELKIIAAVVIGGASLSGGRGSVLGTLAGAAIMAVIASGCTQLELPNPVQDIILGVIIVAAVTLDQLRQRRLRA